MIPEQRLQLFSLLVCLLRFCVVVVVASVFGFSVSCSFVVRWLGLLPGLWSLSLLLLWVALGGSVLLSLRYLVLL